MRLRCRKRAGGADALRKRMADVYGVDVASVLPVAGAARGVELAQRLDAGAVVIDVAALGWRAHGDRDVVRVIGALR